MNNVNKQKKEVEKRNESNNLEENLSTFCVNCCYSTSLFRILVLV